MGSLIRVGLALAGPVLVLIGAGFILSPFYLEGGVVGWWEGLASERDNPAYLFGWVLFAFFSAVLGLVLAGIGAGVSFAFGFGVLLENHALRRTGSQPPALPATGKADRDKLLLDDV